MSLVRSFWGSLGVAFVCVACAEPAPPADTGPSEEDAGPSEPPPFTLETLGGVVYTPGNASVAWAHTLPGEMSSPPEVMRGPGSELIALWAAARRPRSRYVDDFLLARLDADSGAIQWLEQIDANARHALDTQGNIILSWRTATKKLDPDGKELWSKQREPANGYELTSVTTDSHDNVIVARIELNVSSSHLGEDAKGYLVLEKLDPDGNIVWSNRFGDNTEYVDGAWVTADADDNLVLLAGIVDGPFDFGGGKLDGLGVLAKYDANGQHLFSQSLGNAAPTGYQFSNPVMVDTAGNIVVRTESFGDIDLGLGPIFCIRYLLEFEPTGAPIRNVCLDAENITLQPNGGFIAASTLRRDVTVGEVECTVLDRDAEGTEGMLARFDASGAWVATKCAKDPSYQVFGGVTLDPSGMFFMSAAFGSQVTLPDDSVVPSVDDYYTAVIAKVNIGD